MKRIILLCLISFLLISCHHEEEKIEINKINFLEKEKILEIGESCYIDVEYEPTEATETDIYFSVFPEGVVEISEKTKKGFILKGIEKGNAVITASCGTGKDYLDVKVKNNTIVYEPYIILPYVNLELEKGKSKTIIASLIGGEEEDKSKYIWLSSDEKIVSINYVNDKAVIKALKPGCAEIKVSNEKSKINASMVVSVPDYKNELFYLTTEENLIKGEIGELKEFEIKIKGGTDEDLNLLQYKINEGEENIRVVQNNGKFSISCIKKGISIIEISHVKSNVKLEIKVMIGDEKEGPVIETENYFINIEGKKSIELNVWLKGTEKEGIYSFENENDDIVTVENSGKLFKITSHKDGKSIIKIFNNLCEENIEIIIVVEKSELKSNLNYIYTSERIIKTEVGKKGIELNIELCGGNESDRNDFTWEISDSSIIKINTPDGNVKYNRNLEIEKADTYKTKCTIDALKSGIAEIKISHPKCESDSIVKIIVYPEGTFKEDILSIDGLRNINVPINEEYEYELKILSGYSEKEYIWKSLDESIVQVEGNGKKAVIFGKKEGTTEIEVMNDDLEFPFKINIICAEEERLEYVKSFYTRERIIEIYENEQKEINIVKNGYLEDDYFNIIRSDNEGFESKIFNGNILLIGKKEGIYELTVKYEGLKDLILPVKVMKEELTLEKPYELICPEFVGIIKGNKIKLECTLKNAPEYEYSGIVINNKENDIFKAENTGNYIIIEALENGNEKLELQHEKVNGKKQIYVYVENTQEELEKKIILSSDKCDYLLEEEENLMLVVKSNNEEILDKITWSVDDLSKIKIEGNGKYCYVKAIEKGNATITAKYDKNELKYFISIKDSKEIEKKDFKVQEIIETKVGKSIKTEIQGKNLTANEEESIKWNCEDENILIESNGKECILKANKKGSYEIKVSLEKENIIKLIQFIVYDENEESKYVIGIEKYYYEIKKGNSLNINLSNGLKEIPEEIKKEIKWNETKNNVLELTNNGMNCSILGKNEGISDIKIFSENKDILNELNIRIKVYDEEEIINKGYLLADSFNYLKKEEIKELNYKIIYENEEIKNYSDVDVENEGEKIELLKVDNILRIKGLDIGKNYISIKSKLYGIEERILFEVIEEESKVNDSNVFIINKTNYLLNINEIKEINIKCNKENMYPGLEVNEEGLGIIKLNKKGNGIYSIEGLKEGSEKIKVKYGDTTEYIFIGVSSGATKSENIITENIIVIKENEEYYTEAYCKSSLNWKTSSENLEIIELGNGCLIKGKEKGLYELKAYLSINEYRTILVYVTDDNNLNYNLINIDKRRYELNAGENYRINIFNKGSGFDSKNTIIEDVSKNGCCEIIFDQGKNYFKIKALKEGIQEIKIKNENEISIFIIIEGNISEKIETKEIEKNFYLYNPLGNNIILEKGEEKNISIYVKGDDSIFNGNDKYIWKVNDNSLISLEENRDSCLIKGIKEGNCILTVYNEDCLNSESFNITIGNGYTDNGTESHYIYSDKNIYRLYINENGINIPLKFHNIENEEIKNTKITSSDNTIVSIETIENGNILNLNIMPLKRGKTVLTLINEKADFETKIEIIVNERIDNKAVYLTTDQNYSVMKPGDIKQIEVNLKNYEELNDENYKWEIIEGKNNINIIGKGNIIQVYAVKEGKSTIKVKHEKSNSELELYINVSNKESLNKYITTESNNLEIYADESMKSFEINLIGDEGKDDNFVYTNMNESIINIISNKNICYVKGLKEGNAQIKITNTSDESILPLYVNVIVTKRNEDDIYLSCENHAYYLTPGGTNKTISVKLNNAIYTDINDFKWIIYSQEIKNNKTDNVININGAGEKAVITPLNEGIAKIRCIYEPANTSVEIFAYITEIEGFKFENNNVTIIKNDFHFENINIPFSNDRNKNIIYSSSNEEVATVFGTNRAACIKGINKGNAIITAYDSLTEEKCELGINVINEEEQQVKIDVSRPSLYLSINDSETNIMGFLVGNNISDAENEELEWNLSTNNKSLSIYPNKGREIILRVNKVTDINSEYYGKVQEGSGIISIKHKKCGNDYSKTIYVNVESNSEMFKLNDYSLNIGNNEIKELECSIKGGNEKDYNEVIWEISKYEQDENGNTIENIKLLNSNGKKCSVMGVKEGKAIVSAFYNGMERNIEINVVGDKYFNISINEITIFPETDFDLKYDIKPSNLMPQWTVTDDGTGGNKLVEIENHLDDKYIKVKSGSEEGTCQVNGFVNGIGYSTCTVRIKNDPKLYNDRELNPEMSEIITMKDDVKNIKEFSFYYYPSHYEPRIKMLSTFGEKGIDYDYELSIDTENGKGKLTIEALKEFNTKLRLAIELYNKNEKVTEIESIEYSIDKASYEYKDFEIGFRRGIGTFGCKDKYNANDNFNGTLGKNEKYTLYKINKNNIVKSNNNYYLNENLVFGDAETHYIIIKPSHKGQVLKYKDCKIDVVDFSNENFKVGLNFNNEYNLKLLNSEVSNSGNLVFEFNTGNKDFGYDYKYDFDTDTFYQFNTTEQAKKIGKNWYNNNFLYKELSIQLECSEDNYTSGYYKLNDSKFEMLYGTDTPIFMSVDPKFNWSLASQQYLLFDLYKNEGTLAIFPPARDYHEEDYADNDTIIENNKLCSYNSGITFKFPDTVHTEYDNYKTVEESIKYSYSPPSMGGPGGATFKRTTTKYKNDVAISTLEVDIYRTTSDLGGWDSAKEKFKNEDDYIYKKTYDSYSVARIVTDKHSYYIPFEGKKPKENNKKDLLNKVQYETLSNPSLKNILLGNEKSINYLTYEFNEENYVKYYAEFYNGFTFLKTTNMFALPKEETKEINISIKEGSNWLICNNESKFPYFYYERNNDSLEVCNKHDGKKAFRTNYYKYNIKKSLYGDKDFVDKGYGRFICNNNTSSLSNKKVLINMEFTDIENKSIYIQIPCEIFIYDAYREYFLRDDDNLNNGKISGLADTPSKNITDKYYKE